MLHYFKEKNPNKTKVSLTCIKYLSTNSYSISNNKWPLFKKVFSTELLPMVIFCPDIGLGVVGICTSTVGSGAVQKMTKRSEQFN